MIRSAARARATARQAENACRLPWISAKTASRTFSSAPMIAPDASRCLDGNQTPTRPPPAMRRTAAIQVRCGSGLALLRRFQALEQQRQQRVDPRGELWILPFVGMRGMMVAGGGVEHRARRDID